jgi:Kae1-associated kinase Bud32
MIIRKGAEAEIHLSTWQDRKVIAKRRVPKKYRIEALDQELRSKRTKMEAKLISDARAIGIPTPIIFDVDSREAVIIMEYIEGERVKDILNKLSSLERQETCNKIGRSIGKLHKNNIIHGDLTTSNMISRDDWIYFIDFSLGEISEEIEKKGVDVHVLMEAYESTHPCILEDFEYIMEGYRTEFNNAQEVEDKIREIISRGRYT